MRNFQASRKLNLYLECDVFVAYLSHLVPVKHSKNGSLYQWRNTYKKYCHYQLQHWTGWRLCLWWKCFPSVLSVFPILMCLAVSRFSSTLLSMWSIINILWMLWLQHNSGEFQMSVYIECLFCCGHYLQNGHIKKEWWRI